MTQEFFCFRCVKEKYGKPQRTSQDGIRIQTGNILYKGITLCFNHAAEMPDLNLALIQEGQDHPGQTTNPFPKNFSITPRLGRSTHANASPSDGRAPGDQPRPGSTWRHRY